MFTAGTRVGSANICLTAHDGWSRRDGCGEAILLVPTIRRGNEDGVKALAAVLDPAWVPCGDCVKPGGNRPKGMELGVGWTAVHGSLIHLDQDGSTPKQELG